MRAKAQQAQLLLGTFLLAGVLALAASLDPVLGTGMFLVIVAIAAFLRNGMIAVCAFVGATYFDSLSAYTGAALSPIKVFGGCLILFGLVQLVLWRSHKNPRYGAFSGPGWKHHPALVALPIGFAVWGATSAIWATNLDQVKTLSIRLVTDVLVFIVVPIFVQTVQHLRALAWTMLVSAFAAVMIGTITGSNVIGRALGTFTDPNEYAAALVPAAVFALPVVENSRSPYTRWLGRILITVCIFGVISSGSRGGLIALFAALLIVTLTSRGIERVRLFASALISAAVGLGWLVATPAGSSLLTRFIDGDSSGRDSLWIVAIRQFREEPIHGIGLGNYPATAYKYIEGVANIELFIREPRVVHSTPLELLAELGAIGFLLYYAFVIGCLILGWRAIQRARTLADGQLVPVARGLFAATIGALATTLFLSGQYQEVAWVLLACCVAVHSIAARMQYSETISTELDTPPQSSSLTTVAPS